MSSADLPTEVISIITSYIPQRPRLLVLPLVCRRWRTAVLQTITQIKTRFRSDYDGEIASYTHLAALRQLELIIDGESPSRLEVSSALTSLTIDGDVQQGSPCTICLQLTHLRCLTSLDILQHELPPDALESIVRHNSSSLTCLSIPQCACHLMLPLIVPFNSYLVPNLPAIECPQLCNIRLIERQAVPRTTYTATFLQCNSSRLTSLTLAVPRDHSMRRKGIAQFCVQYQPPVDLPKLKVLRLEGSMDICQWDYSAMRGSMPPDVTVSANEYVWIDDEQVVQACAKELGSNINCICLQRMDHPLLAQLTTLTELWVGSGEPIPASLTHITSRLRSLWLHKERSDNLQSYFAACPNLESLYLSFAHCNVISGFNTYNPSWAFKLTNAPRRLRRLRLTVWGSMSRPAEVFSEIITHCPMLEELELYKSACDLIGFLEEVEKRKCNLRLVGCDYEDLVREMRPQFKWIDLYYIPCAGEKEHKGRPYFYINRGWGVM